MGFYDLSVEQANGEQLSMKDFEGKVVMVVNTATGCGFTPHYKDIEEIYETYHDQGFEVIDVPCNQFAGQTPGTDDEVHEFCQLHYNTKFAQMKKSDVNGANELPLYTYLKSQKGFAGFGEHKFSKLLGDMLSKEDKDWASKPDIKWNFTKFLVNKNGEVVERFEPTTDMNDVEAKIAKLL